MNSTFNFNLSGGGLSMGGSFTVQADTPNPYEVAIPAAIAGMLTTRTDNDTGIVTVAEGHGITDADTVDVFDLNGLLVRKGMDVTATSTTTVSINTGTGDNLPAQGLAVRIAKPTVISPVFIDASGIKIFGIELSVPGALTEGYALFESDAPAEVAAFELTANKAVVAHVEAGADNPFSGDAVSVKVTNGNSTFAGVLKIISMEDRTP
jgi:hypothetical protein